MKSLTRDTSLAIKHICNDLIDVCRYLLNSRFNFVLLGEFTADYLESELGTLKKTLAEHIL